jgi:signal transduction histidine kinase
MDLLANKELVETDERMDMAEAFAMVSHDIKNSLGVLLQDLEAIMETCDVSTCSLRENCAGMEYEVRRINNNLVKMLTLFKVDGGSYVLNLDAHSVIDFLHEAMLEQDSVMQQKGIACEVECSDDLYWYFDRNLMMGVMGNVLCNALRYTKDRVRAYARKVEEGLEITIEDNGDGFPDFMLDEQRELALPSTGFLNNNTGLGLYFTKRVLDLHRHDQRLGDVLLSNDAELGGGKLTLLLP